MMIEVDGGHSGITFSSCHFIPRHEKCSRLHGHSYSVRIRLEGEPDENGMVMDFVILKKKLKAMIAEMDHKVLLPAASKIVKIERKGGSIEVTSCGKRYVFPEEDVLMLNITTTTAEEMARMMAEKIIAEMEFPKTIKSVAVGLDEERGQTAWYTKVL